MAGLDLTGVSKTYPGGVTAVHEASFSVADGEFIVLVGPSGCGKSTLLRMIAGLETISSGKITIDGANMTQVEPGDRDIAMVFQNYALYPHMSVYDNMAYGLRNVGMPKPEIETRIQAAAQTLQLEDYLRRKPRQLSGGQRQRVAMGRAIVRDPKVFLFDEPLSNLDAKLRAHMRGELKQMHQRLGATFVFVTHDQVEAMSLADRIVVLNQGKIEQIGAPMELYHRPATLFVAGFIGAPPMNVLALDGGPGTAMAAGVSARPGNAAYLGIRPEAISLVSPMRGNATGTVGMREMLGAETVLHVDLADVGAGADRLVVRTSAGTDPGDDQVGLAIDPGDICWFDSAQSLIH